jgi:hypothetical protein
MSAQLSPSSPASAESDQFIRPTGPSTRVDTASAAKRLALKGAGFATSDGVAAAIREGVATELADAVMAALGSRFERLSDEDVCILAELYTAAPSVATTTADAVVEPEGPNVLTERDPTPPHLPDLLLPVLLPHLRRRVQSPPRRMTRQRMSPLVVMAPLFR